MTERNLTSISWNVGPEYEGPHIHRLLEALKELGYVRENQSHGVAGSQQVLSSEWTGPHGQLQIDAETYIGLVVTGSELNILELRRVYERPVA